MTRRHQITLFSNGIADVQRHYDVPRDAPRAISIPVRRDHLADVLASLSVFGSVRLTQPPRYRATADAASPLSLDADGIFGNLLTDLSGVDVEVETDDGSRRGTLMGSDSEFTVSPEREQHGKPRRKRTLVLLEAGSVRRIDVEDVRGVKFLDEAIASEVARVLDTRRQALRPDTTLLDLEVASEAEDATATLQYTVPVAAWKISYRIHVRGEALRLAGTAIVDNTTEEDWSDFDLAVVTGDPITFQTDIAEHKSPSRDFIQIVQEQAFGASEVALAAAVPMSPKLRQSGAAASDMDDMISEWTETHIETADSGITRGGAAYGFRSSASVPEVEAEDLGGFCLYRATEPVTVPARTSALVPLFDRELPESRPVLHYVHNYHPVRPTRVVELTNESGQSLPRGACTVFEGETYVGSCVVPLTPPGRTALLPHAVESAVRVDRIESRRKQKLVGLRITEGVWVSEETQSLKVEYRVTNDRDSDATLVLDHVRAFSADSKYTAELASGGDVSQAPEPETIPTGPRYRITLPPKSLSILVVTESDVHQRSVHLGRASKSNAYLESERELCRLLMHLHEEESAEVVVPIMDALQDDITRVDAARRRIETLTAQRDKLEARATRVRENLKVSKSPEQAARWEDDLSEVTTQIVTIEDEELPEAESELESAITALNETLRKASLEWPPKKAVRTT